MHAKNSKGFIHHFHRDEVLVSSSEVIGHLHRSAAYRQTRAIMPQHPPEGYRGKMMGHPSASRRSDVMRMGKVSRRERLASAASPGGSPRAPRALSAHSC